ncbi:MAG: hypothetical protein GOU97_00380 [Nanoarchaeota archaeon]|nr:hypothetical protein [Nanoarchaeota archaeon]
MRYKNIWNLLIILSLFGICEAKLELTVNPEVGDKSTQITVNYEITDVSESHNLRIKLIKCYLRGGCSDSTNLGEEVLLSEKVEPGTGSYTFTLSDKEAWEYRFCGTYSGYGTDCDKDNQFLLQNNPGQVLEIEVIKWKEPEPNTSVQIINLPEKILATSELEFIINLTNHLNRTQNFTVNAYAYNQTRLGTENGWSGSKENLTLAPFTSTILNKTLKIKDVEGFYTLKIKTGEHYTTRQIKIIKPIISLDKAELKNDKLTIQLTNRGELEQDAVIHLPNLTQIITVKPQTTRIKKFDASNETFFLSVQALGMDYSKVFNKIDCANQTIYVDNCGTQNAIDIEQVTGSAVAEPAKHEPLIEYAIAGILCLSSLFIVLKKT